jgi:hypothetical protein
MDDDEVSFHAEHMSGWENITHIFVQVTW